MRFPCALAATAVALALGLTACSSDDSSSRGPGFNEADVEFAGDMIQHHAQALSMVDLTMGRDLSPEVTGLAEDIRSAQAPEIETMVDWLEEWGRPVPETSRDHANAHDTEHGDDGGTNPDMPGMMSTEQMAALQSASGEEFEDLWLSMMIEHHEGAITMAEDVQEHGQHKGTAALAEDIIESQRAEIDVMQGLLGR